MIANSLSIFLSLAVSLPILFGSLLASLSPSVKAPDDPGEPLLPLIDARLSLLKRATFRGDKIVREGLILATVSATGIRPVQVWDELKTGQSLTEIAGSKGKTAEDVLNIFDESVKYLLDRAVANGRLPYSLADSRAAWYEQAARQVIDQPGLTPAYSGLHELHIVLITAAIRTSGLSHQENRDGLKECSTLDKLLTTNGHTGHEAVDTAMSWISTWLDRQVKAGKLDETHRASWETSL